MDGVLVIAGVPALIWATLVGLLARGRRRPVLPWAGVTFVAALLTCMAAIALPSLNPGTGQAVVAVIGISGMVWCLLAPVFILRPRGRPQRERSETESDGTIEMAKTAAMTEMAQIAEWVDDAADMAMDVPTDFPTDV